MKKLALIIFLLIVSVLLISCDSGEELFLDNLTCELPCWNGIEMNMGIEEVRTKLTELPETQKESINVIEYQERNLDKAIFVQFDEGAFTRAGFYFDDNKLKVMSFGNLTGKNAALGYWVDEIGLPTSLRLHGGKLTYGIMSHKYYFEDAPLCLEGVLLRKSDYYSPSKKTRIESVVLFDPTYDITLPERSCYSLVFAEQEQPFTGYREYKICPNTDYPCD